MGIECQGFEIIHQEDGNEAVITYFLETFDDAIAKYGLYVEKELNHQVVEFEQTGGIADEREKAEGILKLLMRNQITPCVLNEVLYDFLVERISG